MTPTALRSLVAAGLLAVGWAIGFAMARPRSHQATADSRQSATKTESVSAENAPALPVSPPAQKSPKNPAERVLRELEEVAAEPFDQATLSAVIEELVNDPDEIQAIRRAIFFTTRLRLEDIPHAFKLLPEESSGGGKDVLRILLLHRWAQLDPQAAADFLETSDMSGERMLFATVGRSMAERDVDTALAWAQARKDSNEKQEALGGVLIALQSLGPAEALARVRESAPEFMADDDLPRLLQRLWGAQAPEQTMDVLLTLPNSPARDASIFGLSREAGRDDPAMALTWAQGLPAEVRTRALGGVLTAWASRDPVAAAERFDLVTENREMQFEVVVEIARTWVKTDAEAAVAWVAAVPDEAARDRGTASLAGYFGKSDPTRGARLLESLPGGAARDDAVHSFVTYAQDSDPAGAAAWALTIGNEKLRTGALESVLHHWKRKDESGLRAWLQTAEVPAGIVRSVLPSKQP